MPLVGSSLGVELGALEIADGPEAGDIPCLAASHPGINSEQWMQYFVPAVFGVSHLGHFIVSAIRRTPYTSVLTTTTIHHSTATRQPATRPMAERGLCSMLKPLSGRSFVDIEQGNASLGLARIAAIVCLTT